MSTLPQPQFSLTFSPPTSDMAFDAEMSDFRLPQNYDHCLSFPMSTPGTENHQLGVGQCLSLSDTQYPWHTNQAYHDPSVLASAQINYTPYNLGLLRQSGMQPVVGVSPTLPSPTTVNEQHGSLDIKSASYSTYDPYQNIVRWDNHAAFDLPRSSWPTSDRQPLIPLVNQETDTLWHNFVDQTNAYPSSVCPPHLTHSHHSGLSNDENAIEPFIPHHIPPHQSISPPSFYCSPHPMSSGFPETDPHSHISFYRVPHRDSTGSSYRKRAARAIEYNGLWLDEEELLKGLTEPEGMLNIHPCRWEEDHSPCHLWIRGDKSSINTHIQKWHGRKPGGDKTRVDCRWPACGKMMLKESIARHIVSIHLGEIWECQGCGKEITRNDAFGQHAVRSKLEACRNAGALVTYSDDAQEINARVALETGGRLRYAGA